MTFIGHNSAHHHLVAAPLVNRPPTIGAPLMVEHHVRWPELRPLRAPKKAKRKARGRPRDATTKKRSAAYRRRKSHGLTIVKATPNHLAFTEALRRFAASAHCDQENRELAKLISRVRLDAPGWEDELDAFGTSIIVEWSKRWLKK